MTEEYSVGYSDGYQDGWNAAQDEKPKGEKHMTTLEEAAREALEALEEFCECRTMLTPIERRDALRQAIESEEKQDPVAWMHKQGNYKEPSLWQLGDDEIERGWEQYPLYTTPQKREWVELTDEEIEQVCVPLGAAMLSFTEVARAIEAKLKEKNA